VRLAPAPRLIFVILGAWLAGALAVTASGLLARLQPPWPQLVLGLLVAAQLAAFALSHGFRAAVARIELRTLIALHMTRFVGFYFLWLHGQGRLPFAFAVPGGWGDIVVATGATLLTLGPPAFRARPVVLLWNTLGLIDIVFVVLTAARLALADAASMRELLAPPLGLLPTFLVPLIVSTHLLIFGRLASRRTSV
jgi:hypothetical protein